MLERLTVAEAAKRLNLTQEAVRQRIRRGTIEYDKDQDDKTYVYLTSEETEANSVTNSVVNDYITALKSQIEALERDKEQMREESTRKDHIIMALTNRIPAIEAPSEQPSEQRESTVSASDTESKGAVPQNATEGEISKSWWKRFFGY